MGLARHRILLQLAGIALLITASAQCTDQSAIGPERVLFMRMEPDSVDLAAGDTISVFAFPIDADSAFLPNKRVTWASEDAGIATVDSVGLVTAVSSGKTHVVATAGGVAGLSVVNVP